MIGYLMPNNPQMRFSILFYDFMEKRFFSQVNIQKINAFIDKLDKQYYEIKKQSNNAAAQDALNARP